jgi:hypothetical protein
MDGLENHAEYRAMVKEERELVASADSLSGRAAELRRSLRVDSLVSQTGAREAISANIAHIEEQSLYVRSQLSQLSPRINAIEQEWILHDLKNTPRTVATTGDLPEVHSPNLVYSSWFARRLSHEQLAELHAAQDAEAALPRLAERFRDNYRSLKGLATEYDRVTDKAGADSLAGRFNSLRNSTDALVDEIDRLWTAIFDSKSYIYNLLADQENQRQLLSHFAEALERVRNEQAEQNVAPEALRNYVLQKRMIFDHEVELARTIGAGDATDSLWKVAKRLWKAESLAEFTPVALRERLFLDYADVTFGRSPYSTANPIPAVVVWPRGVIWRVMVGSYTTRPAVTIFKGMHPLAFERGEDRRFRYYAGGFTSDSLVAVAVAGVRKAGFHSATAIAWADGEMIDPTDEKNLFRIEISGVEQLPQPAKQAIDALNGVDLVRGTGGTFVVSPLHSADALKLRQTLEAMGHSYPEMRARLSKILE